MATIEDYNDWEAQEQKSQIGAANLVLGAAQVQAKPDQVAGDLALATEYAKSTGNPTPPLSMVTEHRSLFQQKVIEHRNSTILSSSPRLTGWLTNPTNAAVAGDDIEGMSWFEGFGRAVKNTGAAAVETIGQMGAQYMLEQTAGRAADRKRTFADILNDASEKLKDKDGNVVETITGPNAVVSATARWLDARYADMIGTDDVAASKHFAASMKEHKEASAAFTKSATAQSFENRAMVADASLGETLMNFSTATLENPLAMMAWSLETYGRSAAPLVAAAGVSLATRNPWPARAVMGVGSYTQERLTSPAEFFEEKKLDLSKPDDIQRMLSDPTMMKEAQERGVIRGTIIAGIDALTFGIAGKQLSTKPIVNMLEQMAIQAVGGSGGEYLARVAAGQKIDWNEIVAEGFAEFASAPIDVAVAGREYRADARKSREASDRRQVFEDLSGNAQASALRGRLPDKFREFVATATEGGPVENIFIPAEQFKTYFQGIGVDPFALIEGMEGVTREDLDVALAAGGDLKIPTATYAAHIAGSEHDAFLMENMRFDPDQFTAAEAAEFNARSQDVLEQAFQDAEAVREDAESLRSFETEIRETIVSRLRAAGRPADVAQTEAALYPAFYESYGRRNGMTPAEFLEQYVLPRIDGALPVGMQFHDVTALDRTLAAARSRTSVRDKRVSLLQFISDRGGIADEGGELKARDAEVVKRGRGKKSFKLRRNSITDGMASMFGGKPGVKYGVDAVAAAAIEAGYLSDDPIVGEYQTAMREGRQVPDITVALWDAIDRELRGEGQYSATDGTDPAIAENEAALDGVEQYLDSLGVSLDDDDATIKSAVAADQAGRQYGQSNSGGRAVPVQRNGDFKLEPVVVVNDKDMSNKDATSAIAAFKDQKIAMATGEVVTFNRARKGVYSRDPGGSDIKLKLLPYLREILGGAATYATVPNDKVTGQAFVYAAARVVLNGREASVRLALADVGDGTLRQYQIEGFEVAAPANNLSPEGVQKWMPVTATERNVSDVVGDFKARRLLFQPAAPVPADPLGSKAFKKWFGKSVAVGPDGSPLVVYRGEHGERGEDIQSRLGSISFGSAQAASTYAMTPNNRTLDKEAARPRVMPVYLRIENPIINDASDPFIDLSVIADKLGDDAALKFARKHAGGIEYTGNWDENFSGQWTSVGELLDADPARVRDLYLNAFELLDDADFVEAAKAAGFDGAIHGGNGETALEAEYRVFNKAQVKSATGNNGTFDPLDPRMLNQSAGPGPRGSIQFPAGGVANGQSIIRLYESANLSTFVHETGHFFLTVMQDLAARGETAAAADLAVAKAWWRSNAADVAADAMRVMPDVAVTADDVTAVLDLGTTGDVLKDAAIDVGLQEQWARAFEAYLMDGKAPTVELRSAFEKFRAWLLYVYRKVKADLGVKMSPELARLFDRMLASDEQIEVAQTDAGNIAPVFATAEEMGLTPDEFSRFMLLREHSEDEAKAKLLGDVMAPLAREAKKEYKAEKAKVAEEVEGEVNALRYYRAFEWMANKRWLGDGQPANLPDMRLSKEALVARYGAGVLKTLPRGKQSLFVDGGMDPDEAAGWFGFGSGDEMIRALEKAPKRKTAIEAETDRVMSERHNDPLTDGSIQAAALDAVHGDLRGQWIAAELKAVAEVAGLKSPLTAKEAKATARAVLARTTVRDAMASGRYLAAERKAGKEAARFGAMLAREKIWMDNARRRIATKARAALREEGSAEAVAPQVENANRSTGNYNETVAKFLDAKQRQLMNHALYAESRAVGVEVEKAENYIARLNKAPLRARIAGAGRRDDAQVDYLAAIDEVLERYDFRRLSATAEQRRGGLNAFIAAMTAAGRDNELAIPDKVLEDAARAPYKTIPVEELRGVIDALKNMEHVALRWDKLIDEAQQRELDAVVTGVVEAFDANVKKRPPGRVKTTGEAVRNAGRQFLDLVLNAGTILREIDGFKDMGAAYAAIKAPIDNAMNRLIVRKEKAAASFQALYAVYSKAERRQMAVRVHIPELGYSLSKWERIAVALNLGNEGNRQRLTDPKVRGSLNEDQVAAVIASLDARDAAFIQSAWDFVGSFREDIGARERRTTGVEPAWIDATPVTIAGKVLRGGYYPLKYDARLSALARDDEANDLAASLQAGRFGKAQTRNGHTKARAQSSGRDIDLDLAVMHRHVNQVIYDLELSEVVANSWRTLQDKRVRGAFMEAGKQPDFDALEIWLKDVAEGELRSAELVGKAARVLKSNFTAAKLAFNLSTVAMQITGLAQSIVVVGKKDMMIGVAKTAANPIQLARDVSEKSAFMRTRETTFNKDIYDFYNDPQMGPVASRWGDIKREVIGPMAFWLMTKVQWHIADVPTWYAGYSQGLRKFGNDEAKAIEHADSIVKRSQASGLFSDRSAVERGSVSRNARQNDVVRLFTALGSYMFAKFNVAYERTAVAGQVIGKEGVSLRSAQEALSYSLDMAFLFTLEAVIMGMIKGGLPDNDDEDDGWLKFLAKQTGLAVMGTVPFVRDVAGPLQGYDGGGAYGSITKEIGQPIVQILQGEADKGLLRSVINATGLATGLPATQANRIIDAGRRASEGEDVSPLEYLIGKNKK